MRLMQKHYHSLIRLIFSFTTAITFFILSAFDDWTSPNFNTCILYYYDWTNSFESDDQQVFVDMKPKPFGNMEIVNP